MGNPSCQRSCPSNLPIVGYLGSSSPIFLQVFKWKGPTQAHPQNVHLLAEVTCAPSSQSCAGHQ